MNWQHEALVVGLWGCCDGSGHCCFSFCWLNVGAEELPLQWHFLMVAGRGTSSPFSCLDGAQTLLGWS